MASDYELIEVEKVDVNNLQAYQHEKAQIDMQIATAKAFPRDEERCINNAITIIKLDKETAEKMVYSLVKGGKRIEGASVNLAKLIAQKYGNMRIENRVVSFDATHVTCEAICFDLETNFAIRTGIKKSITGKNGRFSEDMCTIVGNAGNSIALRNAVFSVIGIEVINKLYNVAKGVITGDISTKKKLDDKKALFDNFLKQFKEQKLTEAEIISYCGKQSFEEIDADDVVSLIGLGNSLKSTEVTFETAFRQKKTNEPKSDSNKPEDESSSRLLELIELCDTRDKLVKLQKELINQEHRDAYDLKWKSLA